MIPPASLPSPPTSRETSMPEQVIFSLGARPLLVTMLVQVSLGEAMDAGEGGGSGWVPLAFPCFA